jgi:hypothetical protein
MRMFDFNLYFIYFRFILSMGLILLIVPNQFFTGFRTVIVHFYCLINCLVAMNTSIFQDSFFLINSNLSNFIIMIFI